jgi:Fic family protein
LDAADHPGRASASFVAADGNGRTGRVLNLLFLVEQKILTQPVLYLSRYVVQHKGDYYKELS